MISALVWSAPTVNRSVARFHLGAPEAIDSLVRLRPPYSSTRKRRRALRDAEHGHQFVGVLDFNP